MSAMTASQHAMSAIARMLDANANRAREALRVMEDAARFALNDAKLCGELKSIRHELRAALDLLPPGWLEANRDTAGDVGTAISTDQELTRAGLFDIVVAAGKRLSESLRVIEELSKTIHEHAARQIESLRYRAYEVESRLQLRFGCGRAAQWRLCLLLTCSMCKRPWRETLRAAIGGGADCVQVREKQWDDATFIRHVREVIDVAHPLGASVIVNDRADVALAAGADGVHLGQRDLSVREVRRMAGRTLIVGVSTHNMNEARLAVEAGADYCGVGAMFATALKPAQLPSGVEYLRDFLQHFPHQPHLAVGGITPANVAHVLAAGARGIAVSSAICQADDPASVASALTHKLSISPCQLTTCAYRTNVQSR
jgi:thiamine-phosphate pyrophosphorylase